jgi:hypothetical protein
MTIEDFANRKCIPTAPYDLNDLPRFGQLIETAKDAIASELRNYFSYETSDILDKLNIAYNLEKYSFDVAGNFQGDYATLVELIMSHADRPDKFPMVSITTSQVKEKKLSIGNNFATTVQYPPSLVGTKSSPFTLADGWYIEFKTWPDGTVASETTSTIYFSSSQFSDITNVTVDEIISVINSTQALYYTLEKTNVENLRISCGGPAARSTPNYIEITDGTANCLTALGFTVGDSDTYLSSSNLPKNRYYVAADMTINIDVIGDSQNTKQELADLIFEFFSFYLEKRYFQLLGRSYYDRELASQEWFHIILLNKFAWSSEVVKNRAGKEGYSYIYAVRGSIPITIIDYLDRQIPYDTPQYLDDSSITFDDTIPTGDYFSINYRR